ncbi:MAG: S41 family peptidase [Bacteroidota bacterium]
MNYNNNRSTIIMPVLLAVAVVIGVLIGNKLNFNSSPQTILEYPKTDKLNAVLDYISEEYVDSVSKLNLIELSIPKILENLDPHSIYITADEFNSMNEPLEGNFDGIGVQFNMMHDTIIVINTIPGGPSEIKGVMAGDRIIKINDTLFIGSGISTNDVMKKLKGKRGTKVNISVKRKGIKDLINFEITRDQIPLESIDVSYMINNETGYIKISKFAKTTYQEFKKAITDLKMQGMKKVIIDLRNNSGGYMDGATNIADEFLEDKKLIVYTEGRSRPKTITYATEKGMCLDIDLVILIDEWSASASEILAGAIQDNDRGIIIGRRSFGKGLVQEPTFFSDGSSMRLTVARYYTPTGRSIQKPYVTGSEDYFNELTERYLHGELDEKDSIHFSDSLKYTTPGGHTVYGGGGITPDIFVPVDTSGMSDYYIAITQTGLIYEYAFDYSDANRQSLSKCKDYMEIEQYLDKVNVFESFIRFAEKKGVQRNDDQVEISKKIIYTQLKAYIARNTLDNLGFYPIIKEIDNTLLKAIGSFK